MRFGPYTVDISNADKVFFPDAGITKGELIDYYRRIADTMVPHTEDRPVTMHRFPDGIDGKDFYQHEVPDYFPEWIERVRVDKKEGGTIEQIAVNNAASLVYLANQACITPHVWLSRTPRLDHPDRLMFDLDPPDDDVRPVQFAARTMTRFLEEELGLPVFVMSTGSRGVHLVVRLDARSPFDEVRSFGRSVASVIAARHPERLTAEPRKEKRKGRVFLDTARNSFGQTGVAPYAVRALPGAPVAVPLRPEEVSGRTFHARRFTVTNVFRRLGQSGDPWSDINRRAHSLTGPGRRLSTIQEKEPG